MQSSKFHRGERVCLAHGITAPDGSRVPEGTTGEVVEPWPIFEGRKRGIKEFRYVVAFAVAGRVVPDCWVDEAALEEALGGLFA